AHRHMRAIAAYQPTGADLFDASGALNRGNDVMIVLAKSDELTRALDHTAQPLQQSRQYSLNITLRQDPHAGIRDVWSVGNALDIRATNRREQMIAVIKLRAKHWPASRDDFIHDTHVLEQFHSARLDTQRAPGGSAGVRAVHNAATHTRTGPLAD